MKNDLKQTIQNGVVTLILAVIALAAVIGSGVLVFSPPQFVTELNDEELRMIKAELESRDILSFETIYDDAKGEIVLYAYRGTELPEKLAEDEDVSKRTDASYTRSLGKNENGADSFELIAFSRPQFTQKDDVWYSIEYDRAPEDVFSRYSLNQSAIGAYVWGRSAYADTFYPNAGDGLVQATGSTWATAHDATDGVSTSYTATGTVAFASIVVAKATVYSISRSFFPFVTSSIPAGASIDAASLNLYIFLTYNIDNDGLDYMTVVETSQSTHTSLANADFDAIGTTEGIDSGQRKDVTSISTGAYLTFTLNSTGRSWIKKSGQSSSCSATAGVTCLGVREGHDNTNTAVDVSGTFGNYINVLTSEETGTSKDPYLSVTYSTFAPWQFDPF